MEFWGIEIKPGKAFMVEPEDGYVIHVSQVALGETKKLKEDENVPVYAKVGDEPTKFAIGTLSQKFPQVSLDLFFEQEFELSHNSKSSVYLLGYKTPDVSDQLDEEIESDSEIDEFMGQQCGLLPPEEKVGTGMPESDEEQDGSDSDEMGSDEESDDEEVEDEAPLKVEPLSKKRPNGGAMKNTVASKKAKVAGGKKKCSFPCGSSCKN
ncbi:Histone deacetylase HDT4 [Cardamine amara subsp. amara]|uniref:Histone deacetylase HDT4 n=1 Tax=Cardamine amara subsp. amara TaxID=228776 RepID=A0ABD1ARW4_CARAN